MPRQLQGASTSGNRCKLTGIDSKGTTPSALRMRALDALLTLRPRLFSGACAGEHAPSVARWHRPCGHGHEAGRRAG